jgi:hypothetical protein
MTNYSAPNPGDFSSPGAKYENYELTIVDQGELRNKKDYGNHKWTVCKTV